MIGLSSERRGHFLCLLRAKSAEIIKTSLNPMMDWPTAHFPDHRVSLLHSFPAAIQCDMPPTAPVVISGPWTRLGGLRKKRSCQYQGCCHRSCS